MSPNAFDRTSRRTLAVAVAAMALAFSGCGTSAPTGGSAVPPSAGAQASSAPPPTPAPTTATRAPTPVAPITPTATATGAAVPPATAAAAPATTPIAVASASIEPDLTVAWQAAGPAPSQPCTTNPAIAPVGKLWVAVCFDNDFWIFSPNGKYLETWGSRGSGHGQFDFGGDPVGGVAFAPDGSFYTVDEGNQRVQQFDKDRHFVRTWGTFGTGDGQFAKPQAISVDRNGNVYVGDGARGDVQVFAADGTFLRTIAKDWGVQRACGFSYMTGTPDGRVLLSNDGAHLYAGDGQHLADFRMPAGEGITSGVAMNTAGDVFVMGGPVCSTNSWDSTFEFAPDGRILHHWPKTGEMLVFGADPTFFYATDWNWGYVRKYELPSQ
jgi:hypothetical protein